MREAIIEIMIREELLEIQRLCQPELRKLGVKSVGIFGSVARNEARPDSDVDILVEFEKPATFDGYLDVLIYLEDILHRQIDLVTSQAFRPRIKHFIEEELIYVA